MNHQTEISANEVQAAVREYYGQTLQTSADLRTSACCSADSMPEYLRALLAKLHPQVRERFYGCGSPIPAAVDGACVLDLGCGSGRDVYMLSNLVGANGRVIGVDMTAEQLEVAQRHREFHAHAFGFAQSNVEFKHGDLASLGALAIPDASVDVVVSNCVLNLVPDKPRAFAEIVRVLKPGGELYFSDVFADRRLPPELMADSELVGECLAGAMYVEDFRRLLANLGVNDARICARSPIALTDAAIHQRIGFAGFESITWRAFKLDLEDRCEDYGQTATYLGTLDHHPQTFELDQHHRLKSGSALRVCGNTADILSTTRYARHFLIGGDKRTHRGLLDCAATPVRACAQNNPGCC
ncbi:MAG TPA: methyltransferase domain-containing protein [Rudaea sp.]|nr:methyltransferase domain-containing protein [Rudaea sp.]